MIKKLKHFPYYWLIVLEVLMLVLGSGVTIAIYTIVGVSLAQAVIIFAPTALLTIIALLFVLLHTPANQYADPHPLTKNAWVDTVKNYYRSTFRSIAAPFWMTALMTYYLLHNPLVDYGLQDMIRYVGVSIIGTETTLFLLWLAVFDPLNNFSDDSKQNENSTTNQNNAE